MERFIELANLPKANVSLGVIDGRVSETILAALKKRNIELILTGKCGDLYEAVSYHPDMFLHHLGGNNIVVAPNSPASTIFQLERYGFNIVRGEKIILGKYPYDIAYNVARIGDYAFCNVSYTDKILLGCLSDMGVKIVNVRQGYSKCSICIVDIGAVITSDDGIANVLYKYNFDVLKIRPGYIKLMGLNYGFIGGASGFISQDAIAFAGNIMLHPDYENLLKFLSKYNKKIINLDSTLCIDIGTFIPLKEYSIKQ